MARKQKKQASKVLVEDQSGPMFKEAEKLSSDIQALDLPKKNIADMSPDELDAASVRIVKGNSAEARELRASRKEVRYRLYRLRSEKEGKSSASDVVDEEFRTYFETQPLFQGWKFFAELWDVSLTDPMRVVARYHGEQKEWNDVVAAKFPQLTPEGGVVYPDITVRDSVQAEADKRISAATESEAADD